MTKQRHTAGAWTVLGIPAALSLLHLAVVLIPSSGAFLGMPWVLWLQLLVVFLCAVAMWAFSAVALRKPPGSEKSDS